MQIASAGALGICASRRRNFDDVKKWAEFIRSEVRTDNEIADRSLVDATLAWDEAINDNNPTAAYSRLARAAAALLRGDVCHSHSARVEEIFIREYLSGTKDTERRDALLESANSYHDGLRRHFERVLAGGSQIGKTNEMVAR
jgi:hypothetical protein